MSTHDRGFTIVEMMTTVVVAALLVNIFYQLFVTVVQSGKDVRRNSSVGLLASSILKKYPTTASAGGTGGNCVANANLANVDGTTNQSPPFVDYIGIGNYNYVVSVTCPYAAIPQISLITVTLNYGQYNGSNWSLKLVQSQYVN